MCHERYVVNDYRQSVRLPDVFVECSSAYHNANCQECLQTYHQMSRAARGAVASSPVPDGRERGDECDTPCKTVCFDGHKSPDAADCQVIFDAVLTRDDQNFTLGQDGFVLYTFKSRGGTSFTNQIVGSDEPQQLNYCYRDRAGARYWVANACKSDSETAGGRCGAACGSTQAGGQDAPIYGTIALPNGEAWWTFLPFSALLAVGGAFIFAGLSMFVETTDALKLNTDPNEYRVTQDRVVKFYDVHGVDEAKEELQEIVQFLKDPSAFAALGGRLSKGILLTGPPGTGKTMLARAVAGETDVPFFCASGSEFDEMFVGVGAKRVRNLFKAARENQPAIIFIDELDAIGTKRSARDQQHMKQTLNQLLVEMDGFSPADGVIVIAATNFPQSLDSALIRPGRFDKKIALSLPDIRGREQILKHHLRNTKLEPATDVSILARGTSGFSGADLENLCNQAAVKAAKDGFQFVARKHLEWARDRIVMGAERRSFFMDDKTKLMTAYHEAGHALVAFYTDGAMPLYKVTCTPHGHSLGHTSFLPERDNISMSLKQYRATIDVSMGGRIAEELTYGPESVTSGCSSDLQNATSVAKAMVRHWGMSDSVGPVWYHPQDASMSSHERELIENEVRRLLTAASDRARALLTEKQEELRLLAEALMEHETLDLEEVQKVIKGHKIRDGEKHNVSNVEITTVTSTSYPTPPSPQPVPVAASVSETRDEGEQRA